MARAATKGMASTKASAAVKRVAAKKAVVPATKRAAAPKAPAAKKIEAPLKSAEKAVASAPKAVPAKSAASAPEPKEKVKKIKLVRDSFTMPETEYAVLGEVKKACLKAGIEVKKSELLRIGVALIRQLDTAKLKEVLGGLAPLKAGRPKKSK